MVIGGYDHKKGYGLDEVELVSIDNLTPPVPDCLTQLNPLPLDQYCVAFALSKTGPFFRMSLYIFRELFHVISLIRPDKPRCPNKSLSIRLQLTLKIG